MSDVLLKSIDRRLESVEEKVTDQGKELTKQGTKLEAISAKVENNGGLFGKIGEPKPGLLILLAILIAAAVALSFAGRLDVDKALERERGNQVTAVTSP